jgi:hypothetical protein
LAPVPGVGDVADYDRCAITRRGARNFLRWRAGGFAEIYRAETPRLRVKQISLAAISKSPLTAGPRSAFVEKPA